MAILEDIRAGFAAAITAAFPDVQCTGYLIENPTPPCFEVEPGEDGVTYDMSMQRGFDDWTFTVRGIVSAGLSLGAQKRLDAWLNSSGSQSVKTKLEANRTLPVDGVATVSDLRVLRASGPRQFAVISTPGTPYLGAEWVVRVIATGT